MGVCTRLASALIGLAGAVLVNACGQPGQQTAPPAPTPPPPPPPMPAPSSPGSTPIYPSFGNRLGDPQHIGPDDLHWAVDSAQSSVTESRLISVQPASDAGHPVWNVRLLTGGPSVKQVEVDAIARGAKTADLPAPPADLAQTLVEENAIKTSWTDAVDGLRRSHPDATVSSVALETTPPDPAWKVTLLTGRNQTQYTVNATTGLVTGDTAGPRPPSDY